MADAYGRPRRASLAPEGAVTPVYGQPAVDAPAYVPPAKVYVEDEDEVEEFFGSAPAEQALRGVNPLVVVAIVFMSVAGSLALVLYSLERNIEVTERPSRSTKLVTKPTRPKVEPTENVTGAERQFGEYDDVAIDTPDMFNADPTGSDEGSE